MFIVFFRHYLTVRIFTWTYAVLLSWHHTHQRVITETQIQDTFSLEKYSFRYFEFYLKVRGLGLGLLFEQKLYNISTIIDKFRKSDLCSSRFRSYRHLYLFQTNASKKMYQDFYIKIKIKCIFDSLNSLLYKCST